MIIESTFRETVSRMGKLDTDIAEAVLGDEEFATDIDLDGMSAEFEMTNQAFMDLRIELTETYALSFQKDRSGVQASITYCGTDSAMVQAFRETRRLADVVELPSCLEAMSGLLTKKDVFDDYFPELGQHYAYVQLLESN